MRHNNRNERGAAMVEFAIVLPLLILLVFGIIEFGRGYNANIELRGAAREGARALALGATASQADATVQNASPGLTSGSGVTFPTSPTTCNPGDGAAGKSASITAQYDVTYNIPLLSSGTWHVQATGVMRCET